MVRTEDNLKYIAPIPEEYFDRVIEFYERGFNKEEPLTAALAGHNTVAYDEVYAAHHKEALKGGLTVLVLDLLTGNIAGVALSKVVTRDSLNYDHIEDERFRLSFQMMTSASVVNGIFNKYKVDEIVEQIGSNVDQAYRNRGVAFRMNQTTLELARIKGFKVLYGVATSKYSSQMLHRMGYHIVYKISYEELKKVRLSNGEYMLGSLPDVHDYVETMVLHLE